MSVCAFVPLVRRSTFFQRFVSAPRQGNPIFMYGIDPWKSASSSTVYQLRYLEDNNRFDLNHFTYCDESSYCDSSQILKYAKRCIEETKKIMFSSTLLPSFIPRLLMKHITIYIRPKLNPWGPRFDFRVSFS